MLERRGGRSEVWLRRVAECVVEAVDNCAVLLARW